MNTVEVGYVVTKATLPNALGFAVGMVIHVDDEGVWLCVRRDVESPWSLAQVSSPEPLEPWMGGDIPGGTPGIADIGKCLAAKHRLLDAALTARSQRIAALESERLDFEEQVRTMAIEKAKELGWCTPGLNAALKELGLRPTVQRYKVPVEVSQTIYVVVEAEDEDDAWTEADGLSGRELVSEWADDYDWSVSMPRSSRIEVMDED